MTLTPTEAIRVLLVDDHELVTEGLARILDNQEGIEVVGKAVTAAEGIELAEEGQPDVVLLDQRLPDRDGLDVMDDLRRVCPASRVVVLTGFATKKLARDALDAGCVGFILKTRGAEEVVRAVRAAAADEMVVDPSMAAGLLSRSHADGPGLTERETEVLRLLADGTSTKQIAEELFLSPKTVRNHIQNLLGKLDAHSRISAVAIAKREGLVV